MSRVDLRYRADDNFAKFAQDSRTGFGLMNNPG